MTTKFQLDQALEVLSQKLISPYQVLLKSIQQMD